MRQHKVVIQASLEWESSSCSTDAGISRQVPSLTGHCLGLTSRGVSLLCHLRHLAALDQHHSDSQTQPLHMVNGLQGPKSSVSATDLPASDRCMRSFRGQKARRAVPLH